MRRRKKIGANHWPCDTKVRDQEDKLWRSEELKSLWEGMPGLMESDLEKAARNYKAKTGIGCDGFHPQSSAGLGERNKRRGVEFLEKVEQSGRWPQQACTMMFLLVSKNVTSERASHCAYAYNHSLV